jgi:putative transposase
MTHLTTTQIVKLLHQTDGALAKGQSVEDFYRRKQISPVTYYRWKRKYGGMSVTEVKRLKQLEAENTPLKKMLAEVMFANDSLQEFLAKKL